MSFDEDRFEDPEVHADAMARAYPDRAGMTDAAFEVAILQTATVNKIGVVPCRGRCGKVVDWTQEAEDAFNTWNEILLAKREAPLDKTRIVFCIPCRTRGRIEAGIANREKVDRLAAVICEIKNSANPDRERELLDKARKLGHPDVEGLLEALRSKKAGNSSGRARKGGGL